MSVFYSHMLTKHVDWEKRLFLTKGLTPIIQLANEKRTLLGQPFSNCTQPKQLINMYPRLNDDYQAITEIENLRSIDRYSEYDCILNIFIGSVCEACNCFPTYLNYTESNSIRCKSMQACSFQQHIEVR